MGRMHQARDRSIAVRHFFSFVLLIALPTLIVILFSGYIFRNEIIRIAKEQRYGALEQTADGLDAGMQDFALMASSLINDRDVKAKSLEYVRTKSANQRYLITFSLENIFNRFFILSKQLGSFSVFFSDGSGPFVCRNYKGVSFSQAELDSFISRGDERPGFVSFIDIIGPAGSASDERPVVSLIVNPPSVSARETGIRSLFLSFELSELVDFIDQKNDLSRNSGKYIAYSFLVGQNGMVLASGDKTMIGKPFADVKNALGSRYLIMERLVDTPRWTIAEAIYIRSLTKNVDTLMWYIYVALVLILFLFFRYNTLFFAQIVNPLNELITEMDTVAKGNFSARVEPSDLPELNKLGGSFNMMVSEIAILTSEIKAEQKERLRAEIEALRYQLNPHFLCNTLNSIRMMASISKNGAIVKMTQALMTIIEDNLGRDDTVHSLERELKNIDSYVYIMKVRYGDVFDFYTDIDSSLLRLGVPSMILQPIVENAILHGIHGLSRTGSITVAASRTGETLRVDVRDNGFGMTAEQVERLFEVNEGKAHGLNRIGVYNVHRRMVLLYGKEYDVRVSSYPDEGTVVTIAFPILEPSDAEKLYAEEASGGGP